MWTVAFFAFVALVILIAAPLQTVGAVIGASVGYLVGYTQIGQGAGIAAGIIGFLAGVGLGNELHSKLMPNWKPGLDDAFAISVGVCIAAAGVALVLGLGAFILETWNVK